ncbi:hypothetical protein ACFSBX_18930 [Halobellus rarus]|uniref:Uncharacterized protein n=1 Tax=Halobellus rarus TaxID=1126237 RepID=A0ABD6CVH1_9EURY
MQYDTLRGLETPDTADASTANNTCGICGREVTGISARAPGRRTLEPCGHAVSFLSADELRARERMSESGRMLTDGGEQTLQGYDMADHVDVEAAVEAIEESDDVRDVYLDVVAGLTQSMKVIVGGDYPTTMTFYDALREHGLTIRWATVRPDGSLRVALDAGKGE